MGGLIFLRCVGSKQEQIRLMRIHQTKSSASNNLQPDSLVKWGGVFFFPTHSWINMCDWYMWPVSLFSDLVPQWLGLMLGLVIVQISTYEHRICRRGTNIFKFVVHVVLTNHVWGGFGCNNPCGEQKCNLGTIYLWCSFPSISFI